MTPEPFVTQAQVATYLDVKPRTLEDWRLKGGGPAFVRMSSRAVRYRREDLDRWIAGRVVTSTSEPLPVAA
jgi:predicted DNA-binding transcriptional regulator AlpA